MINIIELILKWAIPFICGAVITGLIAWIKLLKTKTTALSDGVQCLLRAEILHNNEKYMEKGYCPVYAKEALTRAYTAYKALGGNDIATHMYHDIMELPETNVH